jgi:3-isopropylmalate/(R)-2-methylmalate dehydratase large subunit
MITGQVWLRVPETIGVELTGERPPGLAAKDVALAMVATLGADGANYQALELTGDALGAFPIDDRYVLSNLAVEAGAKAAIWGTPEPGARIARTLRMDIAQLGPRIALPHAPDNVVPVEATAGVPVHMVFIGTCTGGRVADFHAALGILDAGGGRLAPGVQLVATPASREVYRRLIEDGTLARLAAIGAVITTPGCGACCGTSGAIPGDGMNVLSTANRNFKARMGNATASIYLASPEACAAAAITGRITDPRTLIEAAR